MNIRTLKQNKTMHPCDSHLRKVIDEMLRNDYALLESPNKPSVILECLTARNDQIIKKYIDTVAFEYSFPDPSLQLHLHQQKILGNMTGRCSMDSGQQKRIASKIKARKQKGLSLVNLSNIERRESFEINPQVQPTKEKCLHGLHTLKKIDIGSHLRDRIDSERLNSHRSVQGRSAKSSINFIQSEQDHNQHIDSANSNKNQHKTVATASNTPQK